MTYRTYKTYFLKFAVRFLRWLKANAFNVKVAVVALTIFALIAGLTGGFIWWRASFFGTSDLSGKDKLNLAGILDFAAGLTSPDTYDQPFIIQLPYLAFSILPLGANPVHAEVTSGNGGPEGTRGTIIRYLNAYSNTDVVQTKSGSKIKEDIILKNPGHPAAFQYQLDLTPFDVTQDAAGGLFFYDKGHKGIGSYLRFTIPAPFMIDATGKKSATSDVQTDLTKAGILTVTPSKKWLANAQYPITLDPTVEITILNVHSHPQQGENWTIDFTTQGTADLKIIPNDLATIQDDEFYSLKCGETAVQPQILANNVVYVPNWSCDQTGQVVFYTKKAGNHTMRFEFGDPSTLLGVSISYAYNNALPFYATGGAISYDGGYEIHTFTTTGSDTLRVYGSGNVDYLVVAGGGSGGTAEYGYQGGGGGGAGGMRTGTLAVTSGTKTVTVGGGGAAVTNTLTVGNDGSNSVFDSIASTGGGGGSDGNSPAGGGRNGGSGGGGAGAAGAPGTGTAGQGNDGGAGYSTDAQGSGGGGGASAVGADGRIDGGGNGGAGTASLISGASVTYAGGGGGGSYLVTRGTGGAGGGGNGGDRSSGSGAATSATVNTGGGGGGGAAGLGASRTSGAGGSGIVIVRLIPVWPPTPVFYAVGGTVTRAGGYEIHTFTNTGTASIAFTGSGTVNYLVVAGGGAGEQGAGVSSNGGAGGGGAGGLLTGTLSVTSGSKTVTVGAGGVYSAGASTNGGNSVFDSIISTGGGHGAYGNGTPLAGTAGGSGGGASQNTGGGAGVAGQGYEGGSGVNDGGGGGGGGASAVGGNGSGGTGGISGAGSGSSISGSNVTYATGGVGGDNSGNSSGSAGGANTGNGGGGGSVSNGNGGDGGSGIVIISFIATLPPPIIFRADAGSKTFTAGQSGNWTVPAGITSVTVTMWGGGGSGRAGKNGSTNGSGGGGGGVVYNYALAVTPAQSIAYSVGSGGAAVNPAGDSPFYTVGNNGGDTSFGSLVAYGGSGGTSDGKGGAGGNAYDGTNTATGGVPSTVPGVGGNGGTYSTYLYGGGAGGSPGSPYDDNSYRGGTSYNSTQAAAGYAGGGGGSSYGAGGAGSTNSTTNGFAGTNGGGGGGAWVGTSYTSGAGGNGKIVLTWASTGKPTIFRSAATDVYTKLLLHGNEANGSTALVDSESRPKTITASGNASTTNAQGKFGNSMAFDGTGDYLSLADSSDFNFGTAPFTIDAWVYSVDFAQTLKGIVGTINSATQQTGWYLRTNSDRTVNFASAGPAGSFPIDFNTTGTLTNGQWNHIAIVRASEASAVTVYINGTLAGTGQSSSAAINSENQGLVVGRTFTNLNDYYFSGYLDELRISKGIARWTAAFTPPSAPYSSAASPVILK